jgi:FlaG/FlaF family flagellin (archaellin)
MNFIFNGFNGQTIDHTTLFYMQLFAADGKVFSPMVANVLILAITVVALALMGIYSTSSHSFNKAQDTSGEQASGAGSSKTEKTKI